MDVPQSASYFQLLLLIPFIIAGIFFLLTQHKILELVRPEKRHISPGQVWLQLIPLVGMVWQFFVISRLSDSIRDELNTATDDSVFAGETIPGNDRPTFNAGILYAVLFCVDVVLPVPLLRGVFGLVGLAAWGYYWSQLLRYKKILKERALLLNR